MSDYKISSFGVRKVKVCNYAQGYSVKFGGNIMENILCIDIGGTRIKASILNKNISLKELENLNVESMETLGWLNNSLPQIISKNHFASLINLDERLEDYDAIAIGVPCKVNNEEKKVSGYYVDKYGVTPNLMEAFKERANCEIMITNDIIAWMRGALNYFKLSSNEIKFPCLAIILGTGVGLAYSDSFTKIEGIEASEQNYNFSNLSYASDENVYKGYQIHKILGGAFFRNVKSRYKKWNYLKIRNEYTDRLLGFFNDIEEGNLFNYKAVKSIIIGGGNSKYVCLSSLKCSLNKSIYILNQDLLTINPDLIPLSGLLSLMQEPLKN